MNENKSRSICEPAYGGFNLFFPFPPWILFFIWFPSSDLQFSDFHPPSVFRERNLSYTRVDYCYQGHTIAGGGPSTHGWIIPTHGLPNWIQLDNPIYIRSSILFGYYVVWMSYVMAVIIIIITPERFIYSRAKKRAQRSDTFNGPDWMELACQGHS